MLPDRDADVMGDPRVRAAVVGEQGRQQLPPPRRERREGGGDGGPQLGAFHLVDDQLLGPGSASTGPRSGTTTVRAVSRSTRRHSRFATAASQPARCSGVWISVEVLGQPQPGHLDHVVRVGVLQAIAADAATQHGGVAGDDRGPGVGVTGRGAT